MQLFCSPQQHNALGLPTQGDIFLSIGDNLHTDKPRVYWIEDRDLAEKIGLNNLLRAEQVWASPELVLPLEEGGVPAHRIRACVGTEQFAQLTQELTEQLAARNGREFIWRGPFGRNSSLAIVNSMIAQGLEERGWRGHLLDSSQKPLEGNLPGVTQSWPPNFSPTSTDGPLAALVPWEFVYLPQDWVDSAPLQCDAFWMPSEYARGGAVSSGFSPDWVRVVPCGIDAQTFHPGEPTEDNQETVFLFVGGTIMRKGLDLLQAAWQRAFDQDSPVRLIIKDFGSTTFYRGSSQVDQLSEWAKQPGHAPVQVIRQDMPAEEIPALYRSADVGVFPYRAEGFCIPALEAMACGLPVILPEHGPTGEFCKQGGWKVGDREVKSTAHDIQLSGPRIHHEVDVELLAQALREAAADHAGRKAKAAKARQEAMDWTWDNAVDHAEQLLLELAGVDKPVAQIRSSRPSGQKNIVAVKPPWGIAGWGAHVVEMLTNLELEPYQSSLTLAFHPGALDSAVATQQLIDELAKAGLPADEIQVDILVAEQASWPSLVLGCDARLELWGQNEPFLGRTKLDRDNYLAWLQSR